MPAGRTYEVMNDLTGFPETDEEVRKIIHKDKLVARQHV